MLQLITFRVIDYILLGAKNIWPCNPMEIPTKSGSNEPRLDFKNSKTYNSVKHPSFNPKIAHNF